MATTTLQQRFNQLELINYIASNASRFDVVVILADDDRTPLEAIESISQEENSLGWNLAYQGKTLLIY